MGGSGLGLSWLSLLDEVEGRGPGDPTRFGGDIARGGAGEGDRRDEIRGESGPCGDVGGDCKVEKPVLADAWRLGDRAADALEETELKAASSFKASPDPTPPKASSKDITAAGSRDLALEVAAGATGSLEKASSNENGWED